MGNSLMALINMQTGCPDRAHCAQRFPRKTPCYLLSRVSATLTLALTLFPIRRRLICERSERDRHKADYMCAADGHDDGNSQARVEHEGRDISAVGPVIDQRYRSSLPVDALHA